MPTFAVIDNGSVENCIVADTLTDAESISGKTCVEYFAVTPGWKFVDNNFVAPTAEEAEAFAAKKKAEREAMDAADAAAPVTPEAAPVTPEAAPVTPEAAPTA